MSDGKAKSTQLKIAKIHTKSRPVRIVGWSLFWLSAVVVVLNWIEEFSTLEALPGGHSAYYLMAGIAGGAAGLWATGVLDAK
ncbi:hypothetical protein [Streptomyces montanisoli]|uniref:Uncharacterized protein n=1 Tax=Streptomyces montanisoli TaxID=2798581 RepID=A0A940M845_9ACTN|nr:hypothetical protein [Streptomyces montanisoli]MBP0456047.1 hypothetical protein [Streptomyces montanisoli]